MSVLLMERQGATEHWRLNDPATRNALTEPLVAALAQAVARAQQDPSLRVVVLQGQGGSFCAGGSLGGFASQIGQPLAPGADDPLVGMNRAYGELLQALAALPQVLIAAVDGAAMGGGLGLVCCADVVLASDRAVFATPEVTLGVVPAQIAPFVQARLGEGAARRWLLSGRKHSAAEALAVGLVQQVVAADSLDAAVAAEAAQFQAAAPGAVAATKRLLAQGRSVPNALLDAAALAFAQALRGPEAAAGLQAFAARRSPPWNLPASMPTPETAP